MDNIDNKTYKLLKHFDDEEFGKNLKFYIRKGWITKDFQLAKDGRLEFVNLRNIKEREEGRIGWMYLALFLIVILMMILNHFTLRV